MPESYKKNAELLLFAFNFPKFSSSKNDFYFPSILSILIIQFKLIAFLLNEESKDSLPY